MIVFDTPLDKSATISKLAIFGCFFFFWARPRGIKTFLRVGIIFDIYNIYNYDDDNHHCCAADDDLLKVYFLNRLFRYNLTKQ